MARLIAPRALVLPLLLLMQAHPVRARPASDWEAPIAEASARFGLPGEWIRRVIEAESAGRATTNGRPIRSRAGAMGLMQLMPGTWLAMRRRHGLGEDPDNPRDNILAGTAYLRAMYDRFGYPGLFAAYNAGPGRYADHLARGTPLPAETVAYLAKVTGADGAVAFGRLAAPPGDLVDALFVRRTGEAPARTDRATRDHGDPGVFFQLATPRD